MKNNHFQNTRQGSVLAVTIILTAILGIIAGSYLRSSLTGLRLAEATLMQNSLLNLAEAGAEEGLYVLNRDDFSGWFNFQADNTFYESPSVNLGNGLTGDFAVLVTQTSDLTARITVESRMFFAQRGGDSVRKQLMMDLGARSIFANGITAEDTVKFNGNNFFMDSFNSSEVPGGMYMKAYSRDGGSVGSNLVEAGAIDLGNANIFGFVATGGEVPVFGPNANVYGNDTPPDAGKIDWDRVFMDFSAALDPVDPTSVVGAISSLPAGTVSGGSTTWTIGNTDGTPQVYALSELSIGNNDTLIIQGPVTIITEGQINVRGEMTITETGSAEIYFGNDFTIRGKGVANMTHLAKNLVLYGTHTEPERYEVELRGNAAMVAALYAPNVKLSLGGGGHSGTFIGAAVAYSVTANGTYSFHYDEALRDEFASGSMRMVAWRELYRPGEQFDFNVVRDARRAFDSAAANEESSGSTSGTSGGIITQTLRTLL